MNETIFKFPPNDDILTPIKIDYYEIKHELREKYLKLRWVISFCDCIMQISKFFCMDSSMALQKDFMSGNLNLSGTQYNFLYSVFAYPLILLLSQDIYVTD